VNAVRQMSVVEDGKDLRMNFTKHAIRTNPVLPVGTVRLLEQ